MGEQRHNIVVADYHRNGIGGAGFYVAIVDTTEDGETNRYLCVDFSGHEDDDPGQFDPGRFAVLRMDQLCRGNIGMHPITHPESGELIEGTGGAAYRGADYWGMSLRKPIREWVSASVKAAMAKWAAEGEG